MMFIIWLYTAHNNKLTKIYSKQYFADWMYVFLFNVLLYYTRDYIYRPFCYIEMTLTVSLWGWVVAGTLCKNKGIQNWYTQYDVINVHLIILQQWRHDERNGVSNHRRLDGLLYRLGRRRSKKTPKLHVTGRPEGNPPVTGGFPSQRASDAENVSIWWRHNVDFCCAFLLISIGRSLKEFHQHRGDLGVAPVRVKRR